MPSILKTLCDSYLRHCQYEKNLSMLTLKAYSIDLNQFRQFIGEQTELEIIKTETIKGYLRHLFQIPLKPPSIRRKMICLKSFFSFLEFEESITTTPFHKLKLSIKMPKNLPVVMTLNDVRTLIKIPKNELKKKKRCKFSKIDFKQCTKFGEVQILQGVIILEILFATAIRVKELSNLNLGDVDIQREVIKVNGKGSKQRIAPIPTKKIKKLLKLYVNYRTNGFSDNLRPLLLNRLKQRMSTQSIRSLLNKYVMKAGFQKRITPHTFRHTTATMLLENGTDIRFVQSLLGHNSIATTQIYTHISEAAQRKTITHNHPRNMF